MKEEIIDILKLGIKNFTFTFVVVSVFVTLSAAIISGLLIDLLLNALVLWLLSEIIYFLAMRVIRFIIKKLDK